MFDDQDKLLGKQTPAGQVVEDMFGEIDGGVPANLPVAPQNKGATPTSEVDISSQESEIKAINPDPALSDMVMPSKQAIPPTAKAAVPPPPVDLLSSRGVSHRGGSSVGRIIGMLFIALVAIGLVAVAVYLVLRYVGEMQVSELDNNIPVEQESQNSGQSGDMVSGENTGQSNQDLPETPMVPDAVINALDSDGDGLSDIEEDRLGTDRSLVDSDNDGLNDAAEVRQYGTDPLNQDTDGDTYTDGVEVANGYNPAGEGRLFEPLPPRTENK